jgi:hypothetical protein
MFLWSIKHLGWPSVSPINLLDVAAFAAAGYFTGAT